MIFKLSDQADKGFTNAISYDTHRPSYPSEVVDALLAHLQIKGVESARVVDLGAGTGKFTELLAARDENYEVVAVEPHEEMRKALSAKVLSTVDVVDGDANNMPVESQSVNTVVAAQSVKDEAFAAMNAAGVKANDKGELPLHGRVIYAWTSSVPGGPISEGG
ncbi:MAG: hypothetical protein Q9213_000555 [Squamulea squamosa]